MIEIVEIIKRTEVGDGVTQPFICRGDDGNTYYVKGRGIGINSLLYEWIAGQLAVKMGLPIAPFELVNVPQDLIEYGLIDGLHELKDGIAFGSLRQEGQWLNYADIDEIDVVLKQDLLVFDCWVKNEDRTLSELGGNPNLLWNAQNKALVVIDHNNAFDAEFDKRSFTRCHIFADQWGSVVDDLVAPLQYQDKFNQIMVDWVEIVDGIPEEWLDEYQPDPSDFDLNNIISMLKEPHNREFWNA